MVKRLMELREANEAYHWKIQNAQAEVKKLRGDIDEIQRLYKEQNGSATEK